MCLMSRTVGHVMQCCGPECTKIARFSAVAAATLTPPPNLRAARLQNETVPDKISNRYEKWFEKREEGSEKRSETCPKMFKPSHAA